MIYLADEETRQSSGMAVDREVVPSDSWMKKARQILEGIQSVFFRCLHNTVDNRTGLCRRCAGFDAYLC
ncbi:hypothetical protein NBRC111894_3178 [Sporolactobacillus inulinus]|uniref:Uncharacterized protein n=1 Tax=Sporolactobacillus inulinus TaxID=2078 RepID=A0A4Y1ZFA1_9BACL|nr:hypothetical protein NBRC111894_3178 [Sporolactobacillus inulinus]